MANVLCTQYDQIWFGTLVGVTCTEGVGLRSILKTLQIMVSCVFLKIDSKIPKEFLQHEKIWPSRPRSVVTLLGSSFLVALKYARFLGMSWSSIYLSHDGEGMNTITSDHDSLEQPVSRLHKLTFSKMALG